MKHYKLYLVCLIIFISCNNSNIIVQINNEDILLDNLQIKNYTSRKSSEYTWEISGKFKNINNCRVYSINEFDILLYENLNGDYKSKHRSNIGFFLEPKDYQIFKFNFNTNFYVKEIVINNFTIEEVSARCPPMLE